MILVLGDWPTDSRAYEGMVLRIRDVDKAFEGVPRYYLQFGGEFFTFPTVVEVGDKQFFVRLNSRNPWHFVFFVYLFLKARLLYVHSLLNLNSFAVKTALKVFPKKKIAIDFHGVVPEEFRFEGNFALANRFEVLERFVVLRASFFVVVSDKMKHYLLKKHESVLKQRNCNVAWILIPTGATTEPKYSSIQRNSCGISTREFSILYSGGMQKWQSIPLVLSLFDRLSNVGYRCSFFTYKLELLKEMLLEYPALSQKLHFDHLSLDQLEFEYASQDFGVVLRDDVIVNQVACPTKIMDYLAWGLVPVVKNKNIGDFQNWGAPFVLIEELDSLSLDDVMALKQQSKSCYAKIGLVRSEGLCQLNKVIS